MRPQVIKCWRAGRKLCYDYADHSTIHGVSYIGERQRSWIEKVWWITVICISIICCGKLIYDAWHISPIIITFTAKPTPIWQIPFPSVMICPATYARIDPINLTDISWRQENGEQYFENFTNEKKQQTLAKNAFCPNHVRIDEVQGYDTCNDCYRILQEMRLPFDEMFVECRFGDRDVKCSDVFEELIIDNNLCYIFNALPIFRHRKSMRSDSNWTIDEGYKPTAPMDTYPRRALGAGEEFGLHVLLQNRRRDVDFQCTFQSGYLLEYTMPYETPRHEGSLRENRMDDSVIMTVTPTLMTTASELHDYPVDKRKCYFSFERPLKYYVHYTMANCEADCVTELIITQCQCVPFYLDRENGLDYCGPSKDGCILAAKNELYDRNYEGCNCLPSCSSVTYESEPMLARLNSSTLLKNGDLDDYEYGQLTIYFKESAYMTAQRTERNGFTAFLANCGGLLGLFLGVSVVSFLEIAYFCTIRLYYTGVNEETGVSEPNKTLEILPKKDRYIKVLRDLTTDYFARTTIQGINYVTESKLSKVERVWWTIIVVISMYCCGSLISSTLTHYDQSPIIINYANEETPISEIPFPAITICPQLVYRHFASMYVYFLRNLSLYDLNHFALNLVTAVAQVCSPAVFVNVDPKNLTNCENCTAILNYLVGGIDNMMPACDYEKHFSQCSDVFKQVMTADGACFEFNTLQVYRNFDEPIDDVNEEWTLEGGYLNKTRQSDAYPRSASQYSFRLSLLAEKVFDDGLCRDSVQGFKVYVHLPNEAPQVTKQFYLAAYSHFSQFKINPRVTTTDPELRDLSIGKRQCYFSDERHLKFFRYYTQNNCEVECVVNQTLSECGCLLFTIPRVPPGVKYCGIGEIRCRQAILQEVFNNIITCNCLSTCTSITYEIEANNVFMSDDVLAYSYPGYTEEYRISAVDIVFRINQFVAMQRSQLFGKTELLANIGGLLGLFLGFSLMSLLELAYFCTLRLIFNLRM